MTLSFVKNALKMLLIIQSSKQFKEVLLLLFHKKWIPMGFEKSVP